LNRGPGNGILDTNYGWDSNGVWFSGNAGNNQAFPVFTNFTIPESCSVTVSVDFVYNERCADFGMCVYLDGVTPTWRWGSDDTRIACQFNCPTPHIYGLNDQTTNDINILIVGNTYTAQMIYDPNNTPNVTLNTILNGIVVDTLTLDEVLPSGNYRIGFSADQDNASFKTYITNLSIRVNCESETVYTSSLKNVILNRVVNPPFPWLVYSLNRGPGAGILYTNYGWDAYGVWFSGSASDEDPSPSYPVFTHFTIPQNNVLTASVDFVYAQGCSDFGMCIYVDGVIPNWNWGADNTRIACQYDCSNPIIEGLTVFEQSEYDLTVGNTYTAQMIYNPNNTPNVTLNTLFEGTIVDTLTLDEVLPSGNYRIGFSADQDNASYRTYIYNLNIEVTDNEGNDYRRINNLQSINISLLTCDNPANMDTTGLTNLSGLNNNDDDWDNFPVDFNFYFLGTNYGNGNNEGIYWDTNSVIGFGPGHSNNPWGPSTGLGILIGNEDRRNNTFWYSGTLTSGGLTYVRLLYFGQNYYGDETPDILQYEIIMGKTSSYQYIEIRTAGTGLDIGLWNIANDSPDFLGTCGTFDTVGGGPFPCGSYLFRSDLSGNNWQFFPNSGIP